MLIHELISSQLKHLGVDTMFGVIGDANVFVVNSFVKTYGGSYVSSSNEAGAVLMALGFASVSNRIGVATVTCGPGFTNTLTALVEGVKSRLPIILLAGQTSSKAKFTTQRVEQRDFALAAGAGFEESLQLAELIFDLTRAFQRAIVERRPIVFNMPPFDSMWVEIKTPPSVTPLTFGLHYDIRDNPELDKAIGIIATAKRPIVLSGYGVVKEKARDSILNLARRIEAPLMTTLRAKDLFYGELDNLDIFGYSARPETTDVVTQCDCIIVFGASMNITTTYHGSLISNKRIIFVNDDPTIIGLHINPDIALLGSCRLIAERITYWLEQAEVPGSGFTKEALTQSACASVAAPPALKASTKSGKQSLALDVALQAISSSIHEPYILATGLGRHAGHIWHTFHVNEPQLFIPGSSFGAIGMALAHGIGAAKARPELLTIVSTGDGAFMLGDMTEFTTAVRQNMNMIIIVSNDSSYGAEYEHFIARNIDPSLSLFSWPDLAHLARALGGQGTTVSTENDLTQLPHIIKNRDKTKPLLIDLKLEPSSIIRFQGNKLH